MEPMSAGKRQQFDERGAALAAPIRGRHDAIID
jgi:hypothetical protein